ncbi:uncharacterized protein LOC129301671 [Prosopis cineraria]|uniref:uncharacterized protein LOC129301664 n=1 Tax=Prosopis cineraria TaxID=364024 RepID=UPI00240FD1EC|nr:uncharacterized protein LOC129301664 [Prosopis cineraria]XP_054796240.1 uncharacterized protein LOC129301671 [Prosopis cineraria]
MDNLFVSEADDLGAMGYLRPPPNYSIDLGAFDLDEALASAGDSCRRFAESKSFVSTLPEVQDTDADAVCSVCMEAFDSRGGNKRISCGHVYHASCITAWISRYDGDIGRDFRGPGRLVLKV